MIYYSITSENTNIQIHISALNMVSKIFVLKFYYFFNRLFTGNAFPAIFKSSAYETHKKIKASIIELVMMFYQAQKTRFMISDDFTKRQLLNVESGFLTSNELKASNEWLQSTFETKHQEQICIMMMHLCDSYAYVDNKPDFSTVATVCKNPNAETYINTIVANILFHPFIDFGCDEDDEASLAIFEALNDRVLKLDALYLP